MDELSKPASRCTRCGAALRNSAGGLCPACLLQGALTTWTEEDAAAEGAARLIRRRRLGGYDLISEVARGGMGVVFRARQRRPEREVALKVIAAGELASPRMVQRFHVEAEAAAKLDHPNIASIYEVGQEEGWHFFSMRLIDGPTLAVQVKNRPLAPRAAAQLMVKIARAVHHAHQRGVLHRDLKPSNILLDSAGEPYLTDFGLAKILETDSDFTLSHAVLGTPAYMPPEQASGQTRDVTVAADVYGLGAVLYEMLAGQPPLIAPSMSALLRKIAEEDPEAPSLVRSRRQSSLPEVENRRESTTWGSKFGRFSGLAAGSLDLDTICLKCLEKNPGRRYATAAELADDLDRWLRGEPIQARTVGTIGRLSRWTQRNPGTAALLLTSILAISALLVGQTISRVRLSRANREVRASNLRLSSSLYELRWRQADQALREDESAEALAWFAYFLRQNPQDSAAAARLLSILSSRNFPVLIVPPLLHEAAVAEVDFSRTGDRLATVPFGRTARVWKVQSGQVEIELPHPAALTQGAFGGESDQRLLTISVEPKARLWDLRSGQIIKEISLGPVDERFARRPLLLTRDRRRMALKVQSHVAAVLEAESGAWVAPSLSLTNEIQGLALSSDGRLLATGSGLEVQLWDAGNNQPLFPPGKWTGMPGELRFSEDGRWLACSSAGKIWVMNTVTGVREREFDVSSSGIAFVANEEHLIVGEPNGAAPTVFNFRTGQNCGSPFGQPQFDWLQHPPLAALLFSRKSSDRRNLLDPLSGGPRMAPIFHEGRIHTTKFHPDGRVVASGSEDRTVRLWSVEAGQAEPITIPVGDAAWEAQWSPSGDKILSSSVRGTNFEVGIWHAQTGRPLVPRQGSGGLVYFAQWAPDGSRFATASEDFTARIWDGETGNPISPPLRHDTVLTYCAFSPDGEVLATAANDSTVRLWHGRSGIAIGAPLAHSQSPLKMGFSKNGRRLVSACNDGTIRVWSVPEGALLLELRHEGVCWVASFSPDDRLLLSASSDGTVRLWDAATGHPALPPLQHEGPVYWASFSPDGRAIATSTEAGIARVWDTATGQPVSEPMRHPTFVWFVKWSPDGQFLATTCGDGSARIWHALTGHLAAEPFSHQKGKELRRAEFSPDGRRLLTASFDGTIKVWDLALLRPPIPAPDWLPELAESLAGKRIGLKDAPVAVAGDSLQRVHARIARTAGQNDYYAHWAKWMLQERLERPVKSFRP